jgi:hypothetical protein
VILTEIDFSGFSHATVDPACRRYLSSRLMIECAKVRTSGFIRKHGDAVSRASNGLVELLTAWCRSEGRIEKALHFPLALRTMHAENIDPVWAAANAAVHLTGSGHADDWNASFASCVPLRVEWRITPACRHIAVSVHSGGTAISLDAGPVLNVAELPSIAQMVWFGARQVPILNRGTQSTFPVDDRAGFAGLQAAEIEQTLSEAIAILQKCAPQYLKWIEDAISAIVPIPRPGEDFYQSFSDPGLNGVVFLSFPAPPLKIAELLVHEISHQYFHYGLLNTTFTNGKDQALYPSPFVQKDRSIEHILLAFHAFANIVLFYRSCLAAGIGSERNLVEREVQFNLNCLEPLKRNLEQSCGLSAAGRSLFEPLREELVSDFGLA